MALAPIALFSDPLEDYAGYWFKAYEQGTTTPLAIAIDSTGSPTVAKAEISSGGVVPVGFLKTAGDVIFIPYVDQAYDAYLFPTESEADWNDTVNAIQIADNVSFLQDLDEARAVQAFDTVADMKLAALTVSTPVITKGYYVAGDGGGADYLVATPQAVDGYGDHLAANGNALLLQGNSVTLEQYGYNGSNAGTVANAALVAGRPVDLLTRSYVVDEAILITKNSVIRGEGDGWDQSVLAAAPTLLGNVIDTLNYDALVAGDIVEGDPASGLACPTGMVLKDFYVKGNKDTYPGGFMASTQGTGIGVRLYGKQFTFRNVRINKCANVGLITKLSALGAFDAPFDPEANTKAGDIQNIRVYDTGRENLIFDGPTDIWLNNIYCGHAWDERGTRVLNPALDSVEEPGIGAHGVVIRASVELGWLHAFGCAQGFGVWVNGRTSPSTTVRLRFQYLMGESNYGNIHFGDRVRASGNLLESHANIWGDGANPHVEILSTNSTAIGTVDIYRDSDEHGSTGLKVDGAPLVANIKFDFSGSWDNTGHGVDINGFGHDISISGLAECTGTAQDATDSTGIKFGSTFDNSTLKAKVRACEIGVAFAASVDNSVLDINVRNSVTTAYAGYGNLGEFTRLNSSLIEQNTASSGLTKRNKFKSQVEFDNTLATQQTIQINHDLIAEPLKRDIQLTAFFHTGSLPVIEKLFVNGVTATQIDVGFKGDGSGSAGATRIAILII